MKIFQTENALLGILKKLEKPTQVIKGNGIGKNQYVREPQRLGNVQMAWIGVEMKLSGFQ